MIKSDANNNNLPLVINLYDKKDNCICTIGTTLKDLLNDTINENSVYDPNPTEIKIDDKNKLYELFTKASYFEIKSNNEIIEKLITSGDININNIFIQPDKVRTNQYLCEDGRWCYETSIIENKEELKPSKKVYNKEIYNRIMEEDNNEE